MKDVVFEFGRFRASLWAGISFTLAALVAGTFLSLLLGGISGAGFGMLAPLVCAVFLAFPIGAVIGHPILHNSEVLFLSRVVLRGVMVPIIASSLAVMSMYLFMFVVFLLSDPDIFSQDPYILFMPVSAFITGPLLAQIISGWLTYPCGFCAAYALQKVRLARGIPESKTIVLLPSRIDSRGGETT